MQRTNLTKKDLINSIYMQIGFSKNISENLIDDFLITIVENLKKEKKLKLSKFGTFSIMGSALFKSLYPDDTAKVALLNIGSEELKGNEIIKETYQQLNQRNNTGFEFKGYIEGNQLMNGDVNVIVADGFTGNVALKTAEGTANFITSELKKAMTGNIIGKISSLLNISNLKKFKARLDPRLYNGAIFIGLDSPVIKSHGGTDYIGFSNSLSVCSRIVSGNLIEKITNNIS